MSSIFSKWNLKRCLFCDNICFFKKCVNNFELPPCHFDVGLAALVHLSDPFEDTKLNAASYYEGWCLLKSFCTIGVPVLRSHLCKTRRQTVCRNTADRVPIPREVEWPQIIKNVAWWCYFFNVENLVYFIWNYWNKLVIALLWKSPYHLHIWLTHRSSNLCRYLLITECLEGVWTAASLNQTGIDSFII